MTQSNELSRVKNIIRNLSNRTVDRGFTEAEMGNSMEKIGDLLAQYDLTMNEVMLNEEPCITDYYIPGGKNDNGLSTVYTAIAKFTGTKVWTSRDRGFVTKVTSRGLKMRRATKALRIAFFGFESDVLMAIYLSKIINEALVTEIETFKTSDTYKYAVGHRRHHTSSFIKGFGNRVYYRLLDMAKERNEEMDRAAKAQAEMMKGYMVSATDEAKAESVRLKMGTSLVVVKTDRVEEAFQQTGVKLRYSSSRSSSSDGESFGAGSNAGNRVNLSRPINSSSGNVAGYLN